MTTDRDRLAADLCPVIELHTHKEVDGRAMGHCYRAADTLIALGWTRLDEERLARALDEIDMASWWEESPVYESGVVVAYEAEIRTDRAAAAIAKEYREDTAPTPEHDAPHG